MKILEKLIKIVLDILTIAVIGLVIFIIVNYVQLNIMKKNYPEFFGYTFFEVETGSMSGTIEIEDVILVEVTQDVKKDDIVTFEDEGEIITHRIIKETDKGIVTKGDANNGEDKVIQKNQVIGKVVKIIPRLGIWLKVFSETEVIICVVVTIVFLGIVASTGEKNKKEKRERSRRDRYMRGKENNEEGKEKEE